MDKPFELDIVFVDERTNRAPVRSSWPTRIGSGLVLMGVASLLIWVLHTAFRAVTDSFVAPIILSPDNDLVLEHKRKVMELEVQRALAQARSDGVEVDLLALDQGAQRLLQLSRLTSRSLSFVNQLNTQQASSGEFDLSTLSEQHRLLRRIFEQQRDATARAKANYQAGLLTQLEYERELTALHQAELGVLENNRARARAEEQLGEVAMRGNALERRGALTPEQVTRDSQLVQLELELLRLNAEKRTKLAEKRVLDEQIKQIVELQEQLRIRPIYQAIGRSLYAAFVPYTQLDGVSEGSVVYQCTWGIFSCQRVGSVLELVPGEVTMPDPWGNPARGQYLLLDLTEHKAATAKTLRVRGDEHS